LEAGILADLPDEIDHHAFDGVGLGVEEGEGDAGRGRADLQDLVVGLRAEAGAGPGEDGENEGGGECPERHEISFPTAMWAEKNLTCPFERNNGESIPSSSWPGLTRPSTSCFATKTWMPGTRPGLTKKFKFPNSGAAGRARPSTARRCRSTRCGRA